MHVALEITELKETIKKLNDRVEYLEQKEAARKRMAKARQARKKKK